MGESRYVYTKIEEKESFIEGENFYVPLVKVVVVAIRFMEMYFFFQTELIVALDFHSSLNEIPFVRGRRQYRRKGEDSLGFYNRWAEKSVLFLYPSIYEESSTLSFLLTSIRVLECWKRLKSI